MITKYLLQKRDNMGNFINTELLPLEVSDSPWLYETSNDDVKHINTGKWMLFYDKSLMDESWALAKKLYRENKLEGVINMKCSTAYENPRASRLDEGIIILYCSNSSNEETIMNIGKNILKIFNYKEQQIIYYKTDLQTREGTIATGSKKNHTYKIFNTLYKGKCLIKLECSEQTLKVENIQKIERKYPNKKQEKIYPERYDFSVFEKLNEINADTELQNDYKKWKNGINYKTNRKIKIDGKIHRELKQNFIINSCGGILFDKLNNINQHEYLKETIQINSDIDVENIIIKDYNKIVDSIIEKIQNLEKWNEFIEFEGKCYGITSKVINMIHRENNCFGEMVFTRKEKTYSSNDRPFCNYDDTETIYSIYNCSKCKYEDKIFESRTGGGTQYVSQTGFYWK